MNKGKKLGPWLQSANKGLTVQRGVTWLNGYASARKLKLASPFGHVLAFSLPEPASFVSTNKPDSGQTESDNGLPVVFAQS